MAATPKDISSTRPRFLGIRQLLRTSPSYGLPSKEIREWSALSWSSAFSARYLIARTARPLENQSDSERWGIDRYQVLIIDRETDEIIGAARKFYRHPTWSWSGISIFMPSFSDSGMGLTRRCPEATRQDLVSELFRKAFPDRDPTG